MKFISNLKKLCLIDKALFLWITFILSLFFFTGCKKVEEHKQVEREDLGALFATLADGSGFFNPENGVPYEGTIVFHFPSYYPLDAEKPLDISKIKLNVHNPNKLISKAGSENNVFDLSKETEIIIKSADGSEKKYLVIGKIIKSSEIDVLEFYLPEFQLNGHILKDGSGIGIVKGDRDLINQKPIIKLSNRGEIHPSASVAQNFNQPVEYVLTAEDGTKKTVVVKPIAPQKVNGGIRKGSGQLLWTKKLSELGISEIDHMSTSIAFSKGKLIINTREVPNKVLNAFNGKLESEMVMGGIMDVGFKNFFAENDIDGNILISNLVTAKGNSLYVYKWKGINDSAPNKFIEWPLDETGWQAGRKMSIKGSLDKDAFIYMGATTSNNTILRWEVKSGSLISNTPEKIVYPGAKKWTQMVDVASLELDKNSPLVLSGFPSDLSYWDLASNLLVAQMDLVANGFENNNSLDAVKFNEVNYLSAMSTRAKDGFAALYNIQNPLFMSLIPTDANYSSFLVHKTPLISSMDNGNRTSDVILKVSDDGYKLLMFAFVTNGSIEAYEFDCINIESL